MSTYLLAFAVSEFRNVTELEPTEFSVYSSQSALNSMRYALDVGSEALRALQEYVGHNYTLSKMDFIAIDDFLMGAMVRWKKIPTHFTILINFSSGKLGVGVVQVSLKSFVVVTSYDNATTFRSSRIMNPNGKRNLRKVQEITNIIAHEVDSISITLCGDSK